VGPAKFEDGLVCVVGDDKFVMSYADASLRIIGKFLDQVVVVA
jgi:hypothetical protein